MDSKERVIRTIKFQNPDRYPLMHMWLLGSFEHYGDRLKDLFERYPPDIIDVGYNSKMWGQLGQTGKFKDEWDITWQKASPFYFGQPVEYPLKNLNELKDFKFPDPEEKGRFDSAEINKTIDENPDKFIRAYAGNLFELMQWLRGPQNLLLDLYDDKNEKFVFELIGRITDYIIKTIELWADFKVDEIWFMDDWGTNSQLFIHPKKWKKFFEPSYRKIIKKIHSIGRFAEFHSDGYIIDIIPELINMGLDVLNPQHNVIGNQKVRDVCYQKICIRTDIDCQKVLPFGSSDDVYRHVKEVIDVLGHPKGGLILHGEVQINVPFENYEAMYDAFIKYGQLGVSK
ncbi:MAG: uroporphyrinogen decarboxylase family protein [Candidatus Humimicrobiaceae bacterium]